MARYSYDGDGVLREKSEFDIYGNQTAIYGYRDGVLTSRQISVFDENPCSKPFSRCRSRSALFQ